MSDWIIETFCITLLIVFGFGMGVIIENSQHILVKVENELSRNFE